MCFFAVTARCSWSAFLMGLVVSLFVVPFVVPAEIVSLLLVEVTSVSLPTHSSVALWSGVICAVAGAVGVQGSWTQDVGTF